MDERVWDYSEDGQLEDEAPPRIDIVDWGDYWSYGLDDLMVYLAVGTDHRDAKIALSHRLIKIHVQHTKIKKKKEQSNVAGLLPEKVLDRLVYGMITECAGDAATPNVLLRLLSLRMKVSPRRQKGIQDPVAYRKLLHVVAKNPDIGSRKAAETVGIHRSVARKWMDLPEFKGAVAMTKMEFQIKGAT